MSIKRFDDANQRLQFRSSRRTPLVVWATGRCASAFLTLALVSMAGCQGINRPYSMHGLTRVPPPGTRPGYPSTDGYYGPNNATSAIQPVGTVVAHNQHGAPWNGQGGLPSTDLTAGSIPQAGAPGTVSPSTVSPASYSGTAQQFDAYGQPLLTSYGAQQQSYPSQASYQGANVQGASTAGANTWSNDTSMNASMAGFTSSPGGFTGSLSDDAGASQTLPSTSSSGSDAALAYPDASNLDWN